MRDRGPRVYGLALSGSRFFAQDPVVVVQLRSNSPSHCSTTTFTRASQNDGLRFKAEMP